MKKLTPLVLILAAAAAAPPARAQDVMQVAPEHYRVLLDNPDMRVVETYARFDVAPPLRCARLGICESPRGHARERPRPP